MIIFLIFNDKVSPLQQEGFQLSYDLSQAANLIEEAIPCLVITEADIYEHVADRLPFTPENLYFIQSILHEKEIPASLLEKAKKALTI